MAFPSPMKALLETGMAVTIIGAVRETRKPVITWDKEKYRDSPPTVVGGAALLGGTTGTSINVAGGSTQSVTGGGISPEYITADSSVIQDDSFTHIPKRNVPKLDTLVEYWDAETVGLAMTISVTTASGSGIITVPNAELLTPGQEISGTGIPMGTIILDILSESAGVIVKTTAVMSQQATATGTVAATLTGSNRVGKYKESEFLGWGDDITTPT